MKSLLCTLISLSLVSLLASATYAQTAKGASDPHELCKGQIEYLRISKIKPTGTIKGFLEAVADHNAWYRSHGINSNLQVVAREIAYDPTAMTFSLVEDEVITIHVNPPPATDRQDKKDAAWDAYVKKYRDNSDIITERTICMPASPK